MERHDYEDQRAVFTLLGELSADVKHILSALDASRRETEKLRVDVQIDSEKLNARLTKVEKFNTRVLAYASIAFPFITAVISLGLPYLTKLLTGE